MIVHKCSPSMLIMSIGRCIEETPYMEVVVFIQMFVATWTSIYSYNDLNNQIIKVGLYNHRGNIHMPQRWYIICFHVEFPSKLFRNVCEESIYIGNNDSLTSSRCLLCFLYNVIGDYAKQPLKFVGYLGSLLFLVTKIHSGKDTFC